jgi:hypothetical protein
LSIYFFARQRRGGKAGNLWHKHVVYLKERGVEYAAKKYYNNNSWHQIDDEKKKVFLRYLKQNYLARKSS